MKIKATQANSHAEPFVQIYRVNGWLRGVIAQMKGGRGYEVISNGLDKGTRTKAEAHRLMMAYLRSRYSDEVEGR